MGQTLTHGVYLPSEGERNCYNGLASNWRLLDGAIGTVAAHTTAIAGKASASHTHGNITNDGKVGTTANLPLITGTGGAVQAGAFGNQANTFCEGNDSRLSDARTPVAHTHGKSDITDLFNSENVWTGRQTYGAYLKSFGEARTDEWSGNSRTNAYLLSRRDTDDVSGFLISTFRSNQAQGTAGHIYGWDILENSTRYSGLRFTIDWDSTLNSGNGAYRVTLGTNTQGTNPCNDLHITQLKTINGINPGALSLPDIYDSYDVVTTNWSTAYNQPNDLKINGADPSYPGWLFIRLDNCTAADDFVIVRYFHVNATNLTFFGSFIPTASSYVLSVPIQAGITTKVWVSKIPTTCKYYACLGTVK